MVVMHHLKVAVGVSSLFRPKVGLESAAWMSLQQAIQSRSTSNGFSHRSVEKCMGSWTESKLQSRESNPNCATGTGDTTGSKSGGYESPSPDRLVYLTSRLIGHQVDVQVKNGSVFSGIFHETNANEDFGMSCQMIPNMKNRWRLCWTLTYRILGVLSGQRAGALGA